MADHEEDDAWRVASTRMLIDFYRKKSTLWEKNYKDNGNKIKTSKVLFLLISELNQKQFKH